MEEAYYRPLNPAAFSVIDKLVLATGRPRKDVNPWLEHQDAYNLHKLVRKRFPRRFYNVSNRDDIWEVDLADLKSIKTYNDGFSYLLVVIDVLSKHAWVDPIKDKSGSSVSEAFERILKRSGGRIPISVQSDSGKEFLSKKLQIVLQNHGIRFKPVRSPDVKAACAERFMRTLKERLWRYFTYKNTRRYVDALQDIVESYNNSRHIATKMAPSAVTLENAAIAQANLFQRYAYKRQHSPIYDVGDLVRISRAKNVFDKGYESG